MARVFSGLIGLQRLALRNLARHKVKTVLTCTAIMVSVAVYIWMDSWLSGMFLESRRNIINYEMGAAKLQTKLYFEKKDEMPAYENFAGWETYAEILEDAGYNTAPRYTFSGTIYSSAGSAPLVINAVDPEAEKRTLAYAGYVELGRYIEDGEFGIALGLMTADKLKVGIPTRPNTGELETLVKAIAETVGPAEGEFFRSCYTPMEAKARFGETGKFAGERREGRMTLRRDLSRPDLDRLWNLLDGLGRNDVRISTVIDYKMVPDSIRQDKWEGDLWPLLSAEERRLTGAAYRFDGGVYLLVEEDSLRLNAVLNAMIRADFSGAVRHVNQVIDAKVVGLVNSPDPATNYNTGYIALDLMQDDMGMMLEGHITELLIRDKAMGAAGMTSPMETSGAIRAALVFGLAERGLSLDEGLDVFFWTDYVKEYLGYEAMETGSTKIFSVILFLLAFIGISNTMLLAILERTREIGMMRALGMTDGQMIFTYTIEAGFLGLAGSVLGIILGCALNYPTVKYGLDFSEMMEQMGGNMGYRIAGNFRGTWLPGTIAGSGLAATLISALMAILPARRAVKMAITESLRFE
ncbi:MAG: FtsX-like permease family protein [Spirochaetaceae bacterium]|jgi:ABC-type lipoprotein release transport system permease subunit|nr:FtsX-like permease family protein [Spirochaetaceae bacterium]